MSTPITLPTQFNRERADTLAHCIMAFREHVAAWQAREESMPAFARAPKEVEQLIERRIAFCDMLERDIKEMNRLIEIEKPTKRRPVAPANADPAAVEAFTKPGRKKA